MKTIIILGLWMLLGAVLAENGIYATGIGCWLIVLTVAGIQLATNWR